jgi:NTE family protein
MEKRSRPKIGLVLGSGGARGLAHIGVIKALEENNVPIDFIAGSSIGSFIGSCYAKNKNIKEIEKDVLSNSRFKMTKLMMDVTFAGGLIKGQRLESFIREKLDENKFSDLQIPLSVVVTNFQTGKAEIFNTGDVSSTVRASMSIPFMFKPVKIGDNYYVDGGLSQPVPVDVARLMGADLVIAVNLDSFYLLTKDYQKPSLISTGRQAVSILRYNLSKVGAAKADFLIEPSTNIFGLSLSEYLDPAKIIASGKKAAQEKIEEILKVIN